MIINSNIQELSNFVLELIIMFSLGAPKDKHHKTRKRICYSQRMLETTGLL